MGLMGLASQGATTTNVHQLSMLGHLGHQGAQQQATVQASAGGINASQLQSLIGQGGLQG